MKTIKVTGFFQFIRIIVNSFRYNPKCQTIKNDGSITDKVKYNTLESAKKAAVEMSIKTGKTLSAYQCACGSYHIGTREDKSND